METIGSSIVPDTQINDLFYSIGAFLFQNSINMFGSRGECIMPTIFAPSYIHRYSRTDKLFRKVVGIANFFVFFTSSICALGSSDFGCI